MQPTPEMRRAVYDADCAELGHVLSFDNVVQSPGADGEVTVPGPGGRHPHIECRRCRKVWLIEGAPGEGYEQAVEAANARLLPEHRRATVRVQSPNPPEL
jgi:hypothetical protein